jgi:outer membrane protein OmpA-like peptidoglycan-associated protein/tetratricopeptide (TPR) repeat protein
MVKYYISLLSLILGLSSFAQEESEPCQSPEKKVLKLINAGSEAPDARTAVAKFNEAIELNDENAMVYYEYAMYAYLQAEEEYSKSPNPALGDKMLLKAESMFLTAYDLCSDYHSNIFYYLGIIKYNQENFADAIKYWKQFQAYKHESIERYSDDHTKRMSNVKKVIGELEYENKVKTEEVPFEPRIVKNVSTGTDEYFPMISPDNELIYYTRKADMRDLGAMQSDMREMFTSSKRPNMKSEFDGGNFLPSPFNKSDISSYGASTLSVDNKELIICACKDEMVGTQPYRNCDLYSSVYTMGGRDGETIIWSELVNLGDKINSADGWEGQPSLSADGKTLYYTANTPTTEDNDIFIVKREEDGTWGFPRPFHEINTAGKDKSPFLHQDSETLYFVSQCSKDRPGLGGLDIFYIRQDEKGGWSEPKNIGYPINTAEDELGLFVSIDGQVAYYSSRKDGRWNIYSFELYEEARPQSVALLKGDLTDENGDPVENAIIEITYEGSDEVTSVKVNGNDGKYAAIVKTNKKQDVMVTVKKEGHAFDSKLIAKEEFKEDNVTIRGNDLAVKKLEVGSAYTINDILYQTNSADLNTKAKFILRGFARFLDENPTINISINGHTDDVGNDGKNLTLSENRAEGVKDYLASLGIDKGRLSSKGLGETDPKVDNDSETNRALNRRTDFVIVGL